MGAIKLMCKVDSTVNRLGVTESWSFSDISAFLVPERHLTYKLESEQNLKVNVRIKLIKD